MPLRGEPGPTSLASGQLDPSALDRPGERPFVTALGNDSTEALDRRAQASARPEARTGSFVPKLERRFVAVPRRGDPGAELRLFVTRAGRDARRYREPMQLKQVRSRGRAAWVVRRPAGGARARCTSHRMGWRLR